MGNKIYKTILFVGLAIVLVFSPIARGAVKLGAITPVLLVLYSLIFLWLFRAVNQAAPYRLIATKIDAPVWLFAILATTSFAFSIYKHDSFYALLRLFGYIGLYYLIVNEFDHEMRKRLVRVAITVGGALSLYGILQYLGLFGHSWWRPPEYLAATYVNHNHFAGYLELVIPPAAAVLVLKREHRFVMAIALVLMLSAFMLTQSRGAWMGLALSLIITVIAMTGKMGRGKRTILIAVLAVTFMAVFVYFGKEIIVERLSTITSVKAGEDPSGGRCKIWQGAVAMVRERPFTGVGIGDFDHGFYRYRPEGFTARAVFAHNDYLQAAAEMGIFAPLVMLWIFCSVVRSGFRKSANPYALGCAAGVVSLALHGAVDFNFHIPANMILFIVWAGIVAGESNVKRA